MSENSPVVRRRHLAVALERAGAEVEHVAAEADAALGGGRARRRALAVTPQHRVDARDELARVERLRQVIVGAHLEADDAIDVLALRGQHDDGRRVARAAQAPAHRQAVLAGQHQVEHEQVRRVALQALVEVARVGQRGDLEALLAEIAGEEIAQAHVVVDDEDRG